MSVEHKTDLAPEKLAELWEQGYRGWEIYTYNEKPVIYCGGVMPAGTVDGWDIKYVFAKRDSLKTYPFFDAVIAQAWAGNCEEIWHG